MEAPNCGRTRTAAKAAGGVFVTLEFARQNAIDERGGAKLPQSISQRVETAFNRRLAAASHDLRLRLDHSPPRRAFSIRSLGTIKR